MSEVTNLINVLSEDEISRIQHEIDLLPDAQSAAIEALQIIQDARGWISDESLQAVAKMLGMSSSQLDSIATFYNLLYRLPVGKHVVNVCDSVSCFVMGSDRLMQRVCESLDVELGQTTQDQEFTLIPSVCLGACDRAPVLMIDKTLFGRGETEDLASVFKRFTE
ncbi:MAG: NADH-quinone oxidoreductase subunit NuoE [Pseudomonadales bacterium]|nr:NADH-quinone oxidoreductase subunit NuoE [Pseudomonadales bacterium]